MSEEPLQIGGVTATYASHAGNSNVAAWNGGEFSFRDLLDTINPLQHLPIISTIYRAITGDNGMGAIPRLVGDTLFGGPIGLFTSAIGLAVKEETGRDLGEHAMALFHDDKAPSAVAVAAAEPKPAEAAADPPAADPAAIAAASLVPAIPAAAAAIPPGRAAAAPSGAVSVAGVDAAQRDFLAQAALQRRLAGAGGGSAAPRQLNAAAVPLQTTAFLGAIRPRPAAAAAAAGEAPPQNAPVEISQQMMDALDKYARMQQMRGTQGAVVDLVH